MYGRAAASQGKVGRAIQPFHRILVKHEGIGRRRTSDVQVIVAEIHAHGCAASRYDLVEPQRVAVSPEQGDVAGPVVHDRHEPAVVLLDSSCIATGTTLAVGRQRLK